MHQLAHFQEYMSDTFDSSMFYICLTVDCGGASLLVSPFQNIFSAKAQNTIPEERRCESCK